MPRSPAAPLAIVLLLSAVTVADAQYSRASITLHAVLDEHAQYNEVWGYTDTTGGPNDGNDYALLGTTDGLAVINVTDPKAPYETGFLPGANSTWRDIKTYQTYAYVTNETGGGMAIIDLTDPENPVQAATYTGVQTAHNIFIDEADAKAYLVGTDQLFGFHILDLANPLAPVELAVAGVDYYHDLYVRNGTTYAMAMFARELVLFDVSDPANVSELSRTTWSTAFQHACWLNDAGTHLVTTDEQVGSSVRVWDVTNPAAPSQTDLYQPNPLTVPHNVLIEGNTAFVSHYTLGVRMLRLTNPAAIVEIAHFDTYPSDDGSSFSGCWGVYPFFDQPDLIVASDRTGGLFVLEYIFKMNYAHGTVTHGAGGAPVAGAQLEAVEPGTCDVSAADGSYRLDGQLSLYTVNASAYGYQPFTDLVFFDPTSQNDIALTPLPGANLFGAVTYEGPTPPEFATVEVLGTPVKVSIVSDYGTPHVVAGLQTVRARVFGYNALDKMVDVPTSGVAAVDFLLSEAPIAETFEPGTARSASTWTVSGAATGGAWEQAAPQPTLDDWGPVQAGSDVTGGGTDCWVTGASAGVSLGDFDVDGGATVLTSSVYDLSGLVDPHVSYWRWYVSGVSDNPTRDFWLAEVSSDGGATWATFETTDQPEPEWVNVDVALSSLITPTNQVVFRFTAQDTGDASITEAALDDFWVYVVETEGAVGVPGASAADPGAGLSLGPATPSPLRTGEAVGLALTLPTAGRVRAAVFDVTGRRVAALRDGRLDSGRHRIEWDTRNASGRTVGAGVYFVRVEVDGSRLTRKVHVLQ